MKENWDNPKWKNKIPSRDTDLDMMSIVWIELGIVQWWSRKLCTNAILWVWVMNPKKGGADYIERHDDEKFMGQTRILMTKNYTCDSEDIVWKQKEAEKDCETFSIL